MHAIFSNVNDAFEGLVTGIANGSIPTIKTSSRVGDVLQIPDPVIVTYQEPLKRVLFNPYRDCNPFFHVYESLWMLAGRSDIAPLNYYSSNYAAQVQDGDNPYANGAYGFRWRSHGVRQPRDEELQMFGDTLNDHVTVIGGQPYFDQLGLILDHLRENPNSRRVVLQMWTVADDLLKVDKTKDVCCNVCAFFSIRKDVSGPIDVDPMERTFPVIERRFLDMTVINRSNDIIWGMLGANVVHFSFLQEYLANCLGVEVGVYNQFSNNAHVYTERFFPEKWIRPRKAPGSLTMWDDEPESTPYDKPGYNTLPLVRDQGIFDQEVGEFVELNKDGKEVTGYSTWKEPFLKLVAQPMMHAFHMHKARDYPAALRWIAMVESDDWRKAGFEWIQRRKANWETKGAKQND